MIINNVLSKLLNKIAAEVKINFHPSCKAVKLTHLSFINDIIIFTNGTLELLSEMLDMFNGFAIMYGLCINVAKSILFTSGREKQRLEFGTHFFYKRNQSTLVVFSYNSLWIKKLEFPLTTKSMTKVEYEPLVDKICTRMLSWTSRHLSFAIHLQLIKSNISRFQTLCTHLPKRSFAEIKRMCGAFLWSASSNVLNKAKVAWKEVCLPHSKKGVRVRCIHEVSRVLA